MRRGAWPLMALIIAVLGFWAPWLDHSAAALRLNGYELSEWVTFLPGVRDGSLPLSRLVFLLPLASLALLLGVASAGQRTASPRRGAPRLLRLLPESASGWLLLVVAMVSAAALFPPFPYLLEAPLFRTTPEFRLQFVVAGATGLALLLTLLLPEDANAALQLGAALLGLAAGLWAMIVLWPAATGSLGVGQVMGIGWFGMLSGLAVQAGSGLHRIFGARA